MTLETVSSTALSTRFYDEPRSAFSDRLEYDGLSPTAQATAARRASSPRPAWPNYSASAPAFTPAGRTATPRRCLALLSRSRTSSMSVSTSWPEGRKPTARPSIHNPELHRLYRKVDQLSDEDQKALGIVLDSLVKRSRVGRVDGRALAAKGKPWNRISIRNASRPTRCWTCCRPRN